MPLRTVEAVRLYQRIAGEVAAAIEAGAFPSGSQRPPERISAVPVGIARTSFRESLVPPGIAGTVECLRPRLEHHSRAPAMHCSTLDDPRAILAARDGDGSGAATRTLPPFSTPSHPAASRPTHPAPPPEEKPR